MKTLRSFVGNSTLIAGLDEVALCAQAASVNIPQIEQMTFDGEKALEAADESFAQAGRVVPPTKADSGSLFGDFSPTAQDRFCGF